MVTKIHQKDIPFIVLYNWAKYHHNDWSIRKAKEVLARRYLEGYYEEAVIFAIKRAAYRWFDSLGEETTEAMLEEYQNCHTVDLEKESLKILHVSCYCKETAHVMH